MKAFEGAYPAIVTSRTADGTFCRDTFDHLVARVYDAGMAGLYVCGNTGEGYVMSTEERKQAAAAAVEASKGKGRVIVHVGAAREAEALDLARHVETIGADAVSSLPPYVQGYDYDAVADAYARLAGTTELPLFIYYIPALTGRAFSLGEMHALFDIERVAGAKFTDHNLFMLEGLLAHPSRPHLFNGHDEVMAAGMAMGAQAGIGSTYNIMPNRIREIYEAMRGGDLESARRTQIEVNRVIRVCLRFGIPASIRAVLKRNGVDAGPLAPPARTLSPEAEDALFRALDAEEVEIR